MIDPKLQFLATLRAKGYSKTRTRNLVFDALLASKPLNMRQLIERCKASTDRASVYRTVELFEQLGISRRLQVGWKYTIELSDQFQDHHHHMSCNQCGRTIELPEDTKLEKRLRDVALLYGFIPEDHLIEIRGRCKQCQTPKKTREDPSL